MKATAAPPLVRRFKKRKKIPSGWQARCPVCKKRRLTIMAAADGRIFPTCHEGCKLEEILRATGIPRDQVLVEPEKPKSNRTGAAKLKDLWRQVLRKLGVRLRDYGSDLLPQHAKLLAASAISPKVAKARGYRSVSKKAELKRLGFGEAQRRVPGLLVPVWAADGKIGLHQFRPDEPRKKDRKPLKYETPVGATMRIDVPPRVRKRGWLGDPARPLFITEGARKADAAVSVDLCCIAVLGVWAWRGSNRLGGKTVLADWERIALKERRVFLVFDSDLTTKPEVHAALLRMKTFLESRGAEILVIYLPSGVGGAKLGLDDFLAGGHTVDELLTLATPELRQPPRSSERFTVENGAICHVKPIGREGGLVSVPLCNFDARIAEGLQLDDGVETRRTFVINGKLDNGESLPPAQVPATEFSRMNWIMGAWGHRAVVNAGLGAQDHLREAIQRLSDKVSTRHVYTHTGWRKIGRKRVFLTAAGALGKKGIEVDIGPELTRYRLPSKPKKVRAAIKASLQLLEIAPDRITVPHLAAVYRAVLASFLPADLSGWIDGRTGSLKSTLAALFLAHYGDFDRLHLPGAWSSTANALERRAFILQDVLFVVDDFAPSAGDMRELESKAARLLRSQGNHAGRGRLKSDSSERAAYPPRGLAWSTGETRPSTQSLLARAAVIELDRADIDLKALSKCQAKAHLLPHALAAFILWLTPQAPRLKKRLRKEFKAARKRAAMEDAHLRVPEVVAHLWIGIDQFLTYARKKKAITSKKTKRLRKRWWKVLCAVGRAQSRLVKDEQPTRRFLRVLHTLLTQRQGELVDAEQSEESREKTAPMLLGWANSKWLFLLPEAAFRAVARFCQESGQPFAIKESTLRQHLAKEGISVTEAERLVVSANVGGKRRRVLKLRREPVEQLVGEAFPK
jgi:hypothetical protein